MENVGNITVRAARAAHELVHGLGQFLRLPDPPIVIGGCERSGTTLLHRVLSAHPGVIAIPDESWALCYSEEAGFKGVDPVRKSRLLRYLGRIPEDDFKGKEPTRWLEKSPANIYYFDQIKIAFNDKVKLIQVVRDGRDVVTSTIASRADVPFVSPRRWVASVRAGLKYLNDPQVLTTRYEDIVMNFAIEMERICRFLDYCKVPPRIYDWVNSTTVRDHFSGPLRPLTRTSIGKWKNPQAKWRDRIQELMDDPEAVRLLRTFGYFHNVNSFAHFS